jgi:uncharacterized membrane protein YoaK (UPF0700 family)
MTLVLTGETLLLGCVLAGWLILGGEPGSVGEVVLAALCGLAMGGQSAVVRTLPGAAVSTTYLTGMLTDALTRLVTPGAGARGLAFVVVLAVPVGALAEVLLLTGPRSVAPALPFVLVTAGLVLAVSRLSRRSAGPSGRSSG